MQRIDKFMRNEELDLTTVERSVRGSYAVEAEGCSFRWNKGVPAVDESGKEIKGGHAFCLDDVSLKVAKGTLCAVVGAVGSGKSSLLHALLGEMEKTAGKVRVAGTIAYAAQQPWIQNATVEDNILFGTDEKDEALYNQVIEDCALAPDLEVLPAGDQTEIGDKGKELGCPKIFTGLFV